MPRTAAALGDLARAVWTAWTRAAPHPLDWLLAIGLVAGVLAPERGRRLRLPLAAAVVLVAAGVVLFARLSPFPRSWAGFLPPLLVTVAAGWTYLVRLVPVGAGRRVRLDLGLAVAVAVVFGVTYVAAGIATSEEPPASDNHIVGILEQHVGPGEQVLIDEPTFGAGVDYYLDRDHYAVTTPAVTPAQRAAGHVKVIAPGQDPAAATATVTKLGGRIPPSAPPPRPLAKLTWLSLWDVRIARR
jgi:hypothetical protein